MAQLVSDFLITPVLRQARRFSAGFAPSDTPATDADRPAHRQLRRASSAGLSERESAASTSAILECDEVAALPRTARAPEPHPTAASLPDPPDLNPVPVLSRPDDGAGEPGTRRDASQLAAAPEAAGPPPGPLPEDDGMGDLRRRIQAIQQLAVPQEEKARMMHHLFTEKYTQIHGSPRGAQSAIRPASPPSPSPRTHGTRARPRRTPGRFRDADRAPTYVPKKPPPPSDGTGKWWLTEAAEAPDEDGYGEEPQLGCEHYRRNVKLQCADCERWYTCRYCHDAVENHILPRQRTKHMLCMLCGSAQKASGACTKCGQQSVYYCGICKLWNDDPGRPIYHCPDCGMCRIGQGLNKDFFHCKKCMACISMSRVNGHKCVERATDADCPICGEYLFSSPRPVTLMQCGHSIHAQCFEELQKTSYRCPLCNKSCVNMESRFRQLDMEILHQPMPADYANARAVVSCNDCRAKSETPYHWLGLKCAVCGSYNTNQLQLLNMPGGDQEDGPPNRPRHEPVALDPAIVTEELRRRIRASRRAMARRGSDGSSGSGGFGILSSSPSAYSAAFLARFLNRSSTPASSSAKDPAARPASSSSSSSSSSSPSPSSSGPDAAAAAGAASSSPKEPAGERSITDQLRATCLSDPGQKRHEDAIDDDDDEYDDADDDMLDLFGMRDRDSDRVTGLTSAESAAGFDDDDEEEEEEEESSDEEEDVEEEEDEEDEEDDILLLGHR
ncbi:hypothetical protein VTJ83DRAFT_6518 [Remersonia thermophila]|uniref:Uncharacterized protein n=1 Tax=Remersonia thermophila TaxID=72144 RepID=A0ABR4D4Y4_9PEZI